jgi:hypothetical protein
MAIEIVINNTPIKDNSRSLSRIKKAVLERDRFSGSIESGDTMFLFKNVIANKIEYYINEFINLKTTNAEVKFVIQTHDGDAESIQ